MHRTPSFGIIVAMDQTTSEFLRNYGELHESGEIIYQPPQMREEEIAIRKKMAELAIRAEDTLPELDDPLQELVSMRVYDLLPSHQKTPLHKLAYTIARVYMQQHINRLRLEHVEWGTLKCDIIPQEQVVVLLEDRSQIPLQRRHGIDPVFQHLRWFTDPLSLASPKQAGIHPDKVKIILRVGSPGVPPLSDWLPRVLPKAVVVNIGEPAVAEAQTGSST